MTRLYRLRRALLSAGGRSVIDSGKCGNDAYWNLYDDGTLEITGSGATNNYRENAHPWYGYRDLITSLVVGDGITKLGDNCFTKCAKIVSASWPNSITSFGTRVFKGCSSLDVTELPENLAGELEMEVFRDCASLALTSLPSSLTSIAANAFYSCRGLTTMTFGENLATIGNTAFSNCSLQIVKFNSTPTTIGTNAFASMVNNSHIYVPWAEGEVAGAKWGAPSSCTVHYNTTYDANGNPITEV